jgi:hypothetical protein
VSNGFPAGGKTRNARSPPLVLGKQKFPFRLNFHSGGAGLLSVAGWGRLNVAAFVKTRTRVGADCAPYGARSRNGGGKAGFNRETPEIRENAPFHHSSFCLHNSPPKRRRRGMFVAPRTKKNPSPGGAAWPEDVAPERSLEKWVVADSTNMPALPGLEKTAGG